MTHKERFINTLQFRPVDRMFNTEIGLWRQTVERWIREGAPADLDTVLIHGDTHFGLDSLGGYTSGFSVPINTCGPLPPFEYRVLEENEDIIVFSDSIGRTRKGLKVDGKYTSVCMDHYIDFPVKDRASFRAMCKHYEGNPNERYPRDWDAFVERVKRMDDPVIGPCNMFGFYSMLRNWMGTEGLSYLFYDNPALIHECLEFLCDHIIRVCARAAGHVAYDFTIIHEDLAGKGGPLIGPNLFREFLLPHYKRYVEFLKSKANLKLVMVDTDGDFEALIPLFLEAGIDGFNPMEVAAGMDPVIMRRKYGKSFCMFGGVDKREIAKGRRAIDAHLAYLAPIVSEGGLIPCIDHTVPPDVSFADFQYYLKRKREVFQ